MCYVGDNLLNAVANYAWFKDARLSRRSIELYEWSRRPHRHGGGALSLRMAPGILDVHTSIGR